MTTHILLINLTEQGVREIKQSPQRATRFAEAAQKLGAEVEALYWTSGGYDGVVLLKAPDDETVSALCLSVAQGGNVRTQTLRAFDRASMESILGKL